MLSVVVFIDTLSVFMLNVVSLSVMAPFTNVCVNVLLLK